MAMRARRLTACASARPRLFSGARRGLTWTARDGRRSTSARSSPCHWPGQPAEIPVPLSAGGGGQWRPIRDRTYSCVTSLTKASRRAGCVESVHTSASRATRVPDSATAGTTSSCRATTAPATRAGLAHFGRPRLFAATARRHCSAGLRLSSYRPRNWHARSTTIVHATDHDVRRPTRTVAYAARLHAPGGRNQQAMRFSTPRLVDFLMGRSARRRCRRRRPV
jgi:hypothetical protein